MNEFKCERSFIEAIIRPIQRNVLIAEYCNEKFEYSNLVDLYYRRVDSNAILMFLIICITFPILFMAVSAIAEKYLSVGMEDLSKRFKLSPSMAATTLIAFANGAPDVLASFSNGGKAGSAFLSIGALFGAFIFTSTLVVANILIQIGKEIKMPRLAVIKELVFYSIAVCVVITFGFIKTSGYPFVIVYLCIYALYIFATIKVDQIQQAEDEGTEMQSSDIEAKGDDKKDNKGDDNKGEKEDEDNLEAKGKWDVMKNELVDEEAGLYQNMVLFPLMASGLLTIPYLTNPLMKTHLKFLVVPICITFIIVVLELSEVAFYWLFLGASILSAVFLILEMAKIGLYHLETVYEIFAVFAAIAWIKIFSTFIIDFITFLAFYFSVNEVVLTTLLLSAGNSLGDFFGNAALAIQGETVMAGMACYSGQIFNNFVGLTANIAKTTMGGDTDFDIFGLNAKEADKILGFMPASNLYVTIVILFVVLILSVSSIYYVSNRFVLKRSFGTVLLMIYGSFFAFSIVFAFVSRK